MFVHLSMLLALFPANFASIGASLEHLAQDFLIGARATGRQFPRSHANVGAIKVEAYALAQFLNHFLRQTSIGAGRTGLGALQTGFNTAYKNVIDAAFNVGMGANHLLNLHGKSPYSMNSGTRQPTIEYRFGSPHYRELF